MLTEASGALAGAALFVAGIWLLRASWRKRLGFKAHLLLGGWLVIAASLFLFVTSWGGEAGTFYGLLVFSLAGYSIVAAGVELRQAQTRTSREIALEPEDRPSTGGGELPRASWRSCSQALPRSALA
ncbi:MAG: hypothetical protein HC869_11575, partial [Rhodospirillales bacterium]|nr:hypothetical protein [Rhodospirillales bacterium]